MASTQIVWGEAPIGGPRHVYRERRLRAWLRAARPGRRVLDAGCGGGSLSLALAGEGYAVTAVDLAGPFLAQIAGRAASRAGKTTFHRGGVVADRVAVGRADLSRLPFVDASFDAVVSGEVLEHLDDDRAAVAEFARVLVPGGVAVVTVPADPARWDQNDDWAGHRRRYTRAGLASLLSEAGLSVEAISGWGFPVIGPYHRFVYLPWALRMRGRSGADRMGHPATRVGMSRIVEEALALAFRADDLFGRTGWGTIGWIARARRP